MAAAESAEKAAEDELVKVNQDGVVGKAEAERLTELNAGGDSGGQFRAWQNMDICGDIRF
ncbi:hypothetical protein LQR18_25895 (plasmid) [Escherichia coli]|nr:hypothetical protein LQR18_25895 [Escherichia coli]